MGPSALVWRTLPWTIVIGDKELPKDPDVPVRKDVNMAKFRNSKLTMSVQWMMESRCTKHIPKTCMLDVISLAVVHVDLDVCSACEVLCNAMDAACYVRGALSVNFT